MIEEHEDQPDDVPINDQFYFVDDSIKERLGGGDGPSFSVASLFSSQKTVFNDPELTRDDPPEKIAPGKSAVLQIWKKQSLFMLDPDDSRLASVGKFFKVPPPDVTPQEMTKKRREINLIVQNKFRRAERNQENNTQKSAPNKFSRHRWNFKKQKT